MDRNQKEKILQELGGIPEEIYDQLVKELLGQMDGLINNLENALEKKDYSEAARIAHFIKGSTGNLRIYPIQEGALSVEKACKEPSNSAQAVELVVRLKTAVQECVKGV